MQLLSILFTFINSSKNGDLAIKKWKIDACVDSNYYKYVIASYAQDMWDRMMENSSFRQKMNKESKICHYKYPADINRHWREYLMYILGCSDDTSRFYCGNHLVSFFNTTFIESKKVFKLTGKKSDLLPLNRLVPATYRNIYNEWIDNESGEETVRINIPDFCKHIYKPILECKLSIQEFLNLPILFFDSNDNFISYYCAYSESNSKILVYPRITRDINEELCAETVMYKNYNSISNALREDNETYDTDTEEQESIESTLDKQEEQEDNNQVESNVNNIYAKDKSNISEGSIGYRPDFKTFISGQRNGKIPAGKSASAIPYQRPVPSNPFVYFANSINSQSVTGNTNDGSAYFVFYFILLIGLLVVGVLGLAGYFVVKSVRSKRKGKRETKHLLFTKK